MKRDMDLVQSILLKIEAGENDPRRGLRLGSVEGHSAIEATRGRC